MKIYPILIVSFESTNQLEIVIDPDDGAYRPNNKSTIFIFSHNLDLPIIAVYDLGLNSRLILFSLKPNHHKKSLHS